MRLKSIRKSLWRALPWLLFAVVVALTLYMDVYVARNILDGDTSDTIRVAHMIAETGDLFPTDVYYSSELKLVDIQLLYSIFFHFTDDWTTVRICGTVLMQALYVLAFLYLCRCGHIGTRRSIVAASLLLMPFSSPYARILLYHQYYISYLTTSFWILGLTMRLMECPSWRKAIAPGVTLAALWVFVGTNGVRHLLILGAPLLALAGVWLLSALRGYTWQDNRLVGERPLARTPAARLMAIALASCVCFMVGYLFYKAVLLKLYTVQDTSFIYYSPEKKADCYTEILNGWLLAIGVRHTRLQLMGRPGLALAAALFSFGYLTWASGASVLRRGEPTPNRLMSGMFLSTFVVTTLVFLFDSYDMRYDCYYVCVIPFALPTLAQELPLLKERAVNVCRKLMILLTCACFLFQGAYTMRFLTVDNAMDRWSGMPLIDLQHAQVSQRYADFMLENGYTHGLIQYWHANVMTELTDGELTVGAWRADDVDGQTKLSLWKWGMPKSAFYRENLPDKLVVFADEDLARLIARDFPRAKLLYTYETGKEAGTSVFELPADDLTY